MPEHITTISVIVMIGGMVAALIAVYVGVQNRALLSELGTKLAVQENALFKRVDDEFVHKSALVSVLHGELADMESRLFRRATDEFVSKDVCIIRESTAADAMMAYTGELKTRHAELRTQVERMQETVTTLNTHLNDFFARSERFFTAPSTGRSKQG
jgi:hypothetical protein